MSYNEPCTVAGPIRTQPSRRLAPSCPRCRVPYVNRWKPLLRKRRGSVEPALPPSTVSGPSVMFIRKEVGLPPAATARPPGRGASPEAAGPPDPPRIQAARRQDLLLQPLRLLLHEGVQSVQVRRRLFELRGREIFRLRVPQGSRDRVQLPARFLQGAPQTRQRPTRLALDRAPHGNRSRAPAERTAPRVTPAPRRDPAHDAPWGGAAQCVGGDGGKGAGSEEPLPRATPDPAPGSLAPGGSSAPGARPARPRRCPARWRPPPGAARCPPG